MVALVAAGALASPPERAPLPPPRPAVAAALSRPVADAAANAATAAGAVAVGVAPSAAAPDGKALRAALGLTGQSGWLLADLDSGEVLDAHAADASFAPASVAKLPTALFALDTLGAGHRFETRLFATGPVREGLLEGDLVLAGGGDPELDTDALQRLVEGLRAAGVRRIAGRFLVDGAAAVQVPSIDPSQPIDVAYNPSVSALNLNYNRVFLRWGKQAGAAGLLVTARAERLDPPVEGVRVVSADRAEPLFVHAEDGTHEVWTLSGRMLTGEGARWLPVRRPELYAGEVLRVLAAAAGVALPVPEAGAAPDGARVLARRLSRPLVEILADMLRHSTNLTAEVVGAAAARAAGAEARSLVQSAAMMNAWTARVGGFSPGDPRIRFVNHSGLTTESRIAPSRMVGLLGAAAAMPALPPRAAPGIGAGAGTGAGTGPRSRLAGPAAELLRPYAVADPADPVPGVFEVRAKTGTMDRIRGLAGYIETPKGRRLAFAIFSNALAERAGDGREIGQGWMRRARAFERALIRSWIRRFDR